MKFLPVASLFAVLCFAAFLSSCETTDSDRGEERLSSMPHNMPQSWEGQAGFPGQFGGQY